MAKRPVAETLIYKLDQFRQIIHTENIHCQPKKDGRDLSLPIDFEVVCKALILKNSISEDEHDAFPIHISHRILFSFPRFMIFFR